MRKARGREKIRVALEQQLWNEIESSHFAFTLHTQPGCYITVPSCSARVTLKEHTPRAISMFDFSSRILVNSGSRKPCETRVGNAPWKPRRGDCPLKNQTKSISAILIGIKQNEDKHIKEKTYNSITSNMKGEVYLDLRISHARTRALMTLSYLKLHQLKLIYIALSYLTLIYLTLI